ncbi:unnamed protein product, partial [Ixodes pacificus]
LAAQVCDLVPGLRGLGRLCGCPLHRHLLHPEVIHVLPAVLRDHPHLCPCRRANSDGTYGDVLCQASEPVYLFGEVCGRLLFDVRASLRGDHGDHHGGAYEPAADAAQV